MEANKKSKGSSMIMLMKDFFFSILTVILPSRCRAGSVIVSDSKNHLPVHSVELVESCGVVCGPKEGLNKYQPCRSGEKDVRISQHFCHHTIMSGKPPLERAEMARVPFSLPSGIKRAHIIVVMSIIFLLIGLFPVSRMELYFFP